MRKKIEEMNVYFGWSFFCQYVLSFTFDAEGGARIDCHSDEEKTWFSWTKAQTCENLMSSINLVLKLTTCIICWGRHMQIGHQYKLKFEHCALGLW